MSDTQPRRVLAHGELPGAGFALALLVSMFALKWFGVDGRPTARGANVRAEDAWNGLTLLRWLIVLTVIVALAAVALHVAQRDHGVKTDTSLAVAALATVTAILLAYRVLIDLPDPNSVVDQKLGALVGLACAVALTACSWQTVRHFRALSSRP
ncbi:MAG TPA: hypothetical protein VKT31_09675 [Solirubrobacteraceae bacterium]|nr:hypothetical protein [Solirubrobacteraceae bacterium]